MAPDRSLRLTIKATEAIEEEGQRAQQRAQQNASFVHLHIHAEYSFLDGASSLEALVRRAAGLGMPALAMTDHNALYGAVKFTLACRQYGIKPILGCEMTMEDDTHLTLIAETRVGYGKLCGLVTRAHSHGGRLNPHLPWSALIGPESDNAGLICLSGCRKGLVSRLVFDHNFDDAMDAAL